MDVARHGTSTGRAADFCLLRQERREEVAAELRSRLQDEHGFPLWQDLADMEGGKDWWQQITQAIDHVEYLVLS
jgi:hypothetical protein